MRKVTAFILLFLMWLILTFSLHPVSLIAGAFVALGSTLLFGDHIVDHPAKLLNPHRYFWALVYIIVFLWECIKANLDVAYRVLHPEMPIHPGIVKVKLEVSSEIARTMLANSITMTPGTISVDIVDDHIYIHWINVRIREAEPYGEKICGKFEKYIRRIFE